MIDKHVLPAISIKSRWNKILPSKVNVFIWRLFLDRLPFKINLSKRGLDIPGILCPICFIGVDSITHLLFQCSVGVDLCGMVCRWWDISPPVCYSLIDWADWFDNLKVSNMVRTTFQAIWFSKWWILWRFRNSVLFDQHPMKKRELFDMLRSMSFLWIKNRSKNFRITWSDWMQSPSNALNSM